MDAAISPAEHAIALAAWVSVHWLRPVPFEEDDVAKAIAWRKDADHIDEAGEVAMPSNPRERLDCCPEIIDVADKILPGGSAKSLWRYHFFEATTDPSGTDPAEVLESLTKALSERAIPNAEHRAIAIGPFVMGPLGVLESRVLDGAIARSEWDSESPTALQGSLASYVQVLADYGHNESYVESVPDKRLVGWSKAWCEWYGKHGPINRKVDDIQLPDGVTEFVKVSFRQDWVPPHSSTKEPASQDCPLLEDWPDSAYRKVLARKSPVLKSILEQCLKHDRKRFFDGLKGARAREATKLLAGPIVNVTIGVLRQLLLLASPEVAVSAAMELKCGPYTPLWGTFSFAEYLAAALLRSYALADCQSMLAGFMARAGGSDYDRVLHYIVKQGPSAVLRTQLSANPVIASALARVTCAPLKFHSVKQWDPTDSADVGILRRHVGRVLGEERPPTLPERAMPFMPPPITMLSSQKASDYLTRGRRRREYWVKTAIQYMYALQLHARSPLEARWRKGRCEVASPPFFWSDQEFVKQLAARIKTRNGEELIVPENAALVLAELLAVLDAAGKMVAKDSPLFLKAVRDAQGTFRTAIGEWGVSKYGNLGAHDNSTERRKLQEALEALRQSDASVRAIDDALPSFGVFKEMIRTPNRPSVVRVEAYEPMGMMHARAKSEHHITDPDLFFRGDRVYSFTDVTRNQVSVNPIVLDWSDWLKWSKTPNDDEKTVRRRSG